MHTRGAEEKGARIWCGRAEEPIREGARGAGVAKGGLRSDKLGGNWPSKGDAGSVGLKGQPYT